MDESKAGHKGQEGEIDALVNAFRYFTEATSTLNVAYRRLEKRIEDLTLQLEEKDRLLYSRLRDLDRLSKYLNSLLESISSGVVAVDLEGQITIFNRTAAEMTGLTAESAIGRTYEEVMGDAEVDSGALHTLRHGPELRSVEKRLPGKGLQVQVGTTWVVDSLGDRIGVVEVFDDVSTLRSLEQRFEQQKTLSALGEMAAAVAHELRNPLAGIGGFAAILKEELADDPKRQKLVNKVIQGVHNLERVANNLLFLTRRTEIKRESIDLKRVLTDIVQLLDAEVHSKELQVEVSARMPEENVTLLADEALLKMIFTNFGRNAIQAVGSEGRVKFRLDWMMLNNQVRVEVADNGCGIPDENLHKLFNPFFTTRAEGTGLGLALVKKAVDLHKGDIRVESRSGEGSRFTVTLPIRPLVPAQEAGLKDLSPDGQEPRAVT